MVIIYSNSMDQPGKVANPARGQLNRNNKYSFSLCPFALENLVSRDGFGSPVYYTDSRLFDDMKRAESLLLIEDLCSTRCQKNNGEKYRGLYLNFEMETCTASSPHRGSIFTSHVTLLGGYSAT